MILKVYRDKQFKCIKARKFAVFKAEHKCVMAITPDGREWLLPEGSTLKAIEAVVPGLIRISRGVLVKRREVIGMFRTRNGNSYSVTVQTTVGDFRLARRNCVKSIIALVEQNAGTRPNKPTESPE